MENKKDAFIPIIIAIVIIGIFSFLHLSNANSELVKLKIIEKNKVKIFSQADHISRQLVQKKSELVEFNQQQRVILNSANWQTMQNRNAMLGQNNNISNVLNSLEQLNTSNVEMKQQLNSLIAEINKIKLDNEKESIPYWIKMVISIVLIIGAFILILLKSVSVKYKKLANAIILGLIGVWFGIELKL